MSDSIPPDEAELYRSHDERKRRPCVSHFACDCLHARLEAWRPIVWRAMVWLHSGKSAQDEVIALGNLADAVSKLAPELRP